MSTQPPDDYQLPQAVRERIPRYRRVLLNLVIVPFLAAIIPLLILAVVNYQQDSDSYLSENRYELTRLLSSTKRSLQFAIEERRALLSLIARTKSHVELGDESHLKATLRDLRETFGDFVDLGLVTSSGRQSCYVGPYKLQGTNYAQEDWFQEVSLRGVYVSDVFLGHRKFPHFVIAVTRELEDGDFYVLRATIDTELLDRQFFSLDLAENIDAFVVNQQGILQTRSAFYGDVLSNSGLTIPPNLREQEIIRELGQQKNRLLTVGFSYVEGTPFVLVTAMNSLPPFQHWLQKRYDVFFFLIVSVIGILIVVYWRSKRIVTRLREADTERARAYHHIEYTNKMATLGRLAAGVAHEINNPLAIINEKAGLLKDITGSIPDFPKKDKFIGIADSICTSVERCSRVTHRLLGFGRRMDLSKEQIDLESLMNDVLEFQRTEAAHRDITVNLDVAEDVPVIESDRGQLQQVFLNLINNASSAVQDGGRIDIVIRHPNPNEVSIAIKDNGSGIPPEDLAHIFEPFYSTKGEAGTGLGLSITREIVEKLGGIIEVESEVGKGSRFTVNLPIEKVQ